MAIMVSFIPVRATALLVKLINPVPAERDIIGKNHTPEKQVEGLIKMNESDLFKLIPGDIIRNKASGNTYIILVNYGDHAIATRSIDIIHPDEWELVFKSVLVKPVPYDQHHPLCTYV